MALNWELFYTPPPPKKHLSMSGGSFGRHSDRAATDIEWVESRGAAKQPTMHKTAPNSKELSSPKWQ